jgi:hypothetical protein
MLAVLAACSVPRMQIEAKVPAPLITPMPLSVGVRLPAAFVGHIQKEDFGESSFELAFGTTQAAAVRRVTSAMFEHAVQLDAGAAAPDLQALLDLSLDSFTFVLPVENAAEYYSATIGYRVDISGPDGGALGSWIFEGYGSVPARGTSRKAGIADATALAIRDACANIAVHLPQQEIMRKLLAPPAPPAAPEADRHDEASTT